MESFRSEFAAYVTVDSHLTMAKGIYHLKYMATEATEYFKEQFRSPSAVALPDPYAICKFILREQRWEPILSQAFLIKNIFLSIASSNTLQHIFCSLQRSRMALPELL